MKLTTEKYDPRNDSKTQPRVEEQQSVLTFNVGSNFKIKASEGSVSLHGVVRLK